MMSAGAIGYLSKSCEPRDVVFAIRRVIHGQRYIEGNVARALLEQGMDGRRTPIDDLSRRELEGLTMVSHAHTQDGIARRLCVSTKTVSTARTGAPRPPPGGPPPPGAPAGPGPAAGPAASASPTPMSPIYRGTTVCGRPPGPDELRRRASDPRGGGGARAVFCGGLRLSSPRTRPVPLRSFLRSQSFRPNPSTTWPSLGPRTRSASLVRVRPSCSSIPFPAPPSSPSAPQRGSATAASAEFIARSSPK